jgi:5-methylcytosine-specific restriction protein A
LCPLFAEPGKSRCLAHQRAEWRDQNARRDRSLRAFYDSAEWTALRLAYKALHPLCETCLNEGRESLTQQIDHLVPVREAPDRALDDTNLRALCVSCHSRRTMTDRHRGAGPREGRSKSL